MKEDPNYQRDIFSLNQFRDRLPVLISSCHTLTFCSLSFQVPFHHTHTGFCPLAGSSGESACVLAGGGSQLRDKAPLHTANSSLCEPPLPLLRPLPPPLLHPDTGTHTFPPKKSLCATNSRSPLSQIYPALKKLPGHHHP